MADSRRYKTEKGMPLLPGVNRLERGYNFTVEVPEGKNASLVLYKKRSKKLCMEIPFTSENKAGEVYSLFLPDFLPEGYEYNFLLDGQVYIDPWAYGISGRERFGAAIDPEAHKVRCTFWNPGDYDWEGDQCLNIPYHEMILYKLHVRGYTKANSQIKGKKGTFQALEEMIPYWQELGINAIEMMPVYEFMETVPEKYYAGSMVSEKKVNKKVNYWGYTAGYYMAPKRSYSATNDPAQEFRHLIQAMHKAGIACILEMYFPAGTNPFLALRALQSWKLNFHVDGFHVLGDGAPIQLLMRDGILSDSKLMFHGFDERDIRGKKEPAQKCVAEYNPGFLQDMRRFLKSDEEMVEGAAWHVRRNPDRYAVINYMACQDGFTLNDMVTYNYRHNEANYENNQDGSSYNYSWNCGVEGPTRKMNIRQLREQQLRNAFLMVLLSQGVPMIYGGDEIGNSQNGNNNAYCQDNSIGWIDWKGLKKNESLLEFVKAVIAFRKEHPILHTPGELRGVDYQTRGLPDVSVHGERAWFLNSENTSRLLGIMYYGAYARRKDGTYDDSIYIAYNFHWENRSVALPNLPGKGCWTKVIDTSMLKTNGLCYDDEKHSRKLEIAPRTIVVLLAKQEEKKNAPMAAL